MTSVGYMSMRTRSRSYIDCELNNIRLAFVRGAKTINASWSDDYPYQVGRDLEPPLTARNSPRYHLRGHYLLLALQMTMFPYSNSRYWTR